MLCATAALRRDTPRPGIWKIIRTFRSPPIQRLLFAWGLMLAGIGHSLDKENSGTADEDRTTQSSPRTSSRIAPTPQTAGSGRTDKLLRAAPTEPAGKSPPPVLLLR